MAKNTKVRCELIRGNGNKRMVRLARAPGVINDAKEPGVVYTYATSRPTGKDGEDRVMVYRQVGHVIAA
jgi:hypothetical protein